MQQLLTLRNYLGLSQQAMASLLGTSRATISLVELGQRVLPDTAWLRFSQLQQQISARPKPVKKRRQTNYVRLPRRPAEDLEQLRLYLLQKSLQLKIQADLMQQKREAAAAALAHLEKAFPKPNKQQKNMLQIVTYEAGIHLDRHTEKLVAEYRKLSNLLAKAGQ